MQSSRQAGQSNFVPVVTLRQESFVCVKVTPTPQSFLLFWHCSIFFLSLIVKGWICHLCCSVAKAKEVSKEPQSVQANEGPGFLYLA